MPIAAMVDQADLAVEPFQFGVGDPSSTASQDALTVGPHRLGQGDKGRDAAATGPRLLTPVEMEWSSTACLDSTER